MQTKKTSENLVGFRDVFFIETFIHIRLDSLTASSRNPHTYL